MIPELGQFALVLALLLAGLQMFFGIVGPKLGHERWMHAVTAAVAGQFVMVVTAFACLVTSFVVHDYSVGYVFMNSNSALPLFYRVAATWGAHEGSLLLWILILSIWTVLVALGSKRLPLHFSTRVLGVLGLVSFAFLLFTLATSNPFTRIPLQADGRDLNPVLQDPALAIHPPMLYTGYVGFAVAFAFACAAMLEGRLDQTWARWTRPWTTAAWAFLTVGIMFGSWWAYYELGWGGYWFWDPVENASFMPWLVGTALIHSLAVTDKRGLFKSWTLLLAVLAFSLSLLGTFLVRSGITVSVHSFAADPTRGVFILVFLCVIIGGALTLYAWRAPLLKSQAGFELSSRESFLLFNNILLVVAFGTVFGGTMAPLIVDFLGQPTLSVGPPYFNVTFLLPILPLLALVSVGIQANWKRGKLSEKQRALFGTLAVALALALAIAIGLFSDPGVLTIVSLTLGFWIIGSSLVDPIDRWRRKLTLSRSVLGMTLAHVGLGLFVIAVTAVEAFSIERDVALGRRETVQVGPYEYRFEKVEPVEGPNYGGTRGEIRVFRNGEPVTTLYPEKREYWVQRSVMTEAGIESRWGSDLFAALGDDLGEGRWSIRAQYRPMINLIWYSALLMALGGLLAGTDRRYRTASVTQTSQAPQPAAGVAPSGAATRSAS
jgi:cytochrome c-type biogenesis protein CcmF